MSARNRHEEKAVRREQRAEANGQREFMGAVAFALQAARAVLAIPQGTLEDAVRFGEKLIQPGISIDDALEVEQGLRALRALLVYKQKLDQTKTEEVPDAN